MTIVVVVICIAPEFLDSVQILQALLQAYEEAIPHSEEGTFQIQPPRQQYCYRDLDDANRTFNEVEGVYLQ